MKSSPPSTAEQLSALADGQLGDGELAPVLALCARDEHFQASWRDYHLIGDVLRGQASPAGADEAAFLARLRAAWEVPEQARVTAPSAANQPEFRQAWQVAAAVVAVVGVLLWALPGVSTEDLPSAVGDSPVLVALPQANLIRDAALDELLEDHRQQGGASVLPMPSGFLRNALFEAEPAVFTGPDAEAMSQRRTALRVLALSACLWLGGVAAQTGPAEPTAAAAQLQAWLARMHEGNRSQAYVGTFVVSAGSHLSSARIWHVCEGDEQVERVDSLTGAPRSVFRHNDQVLTVWPDIGRVRSERRESLGLFLDRLRTADGSLAEHYRVEIPGQVERVAGIPAVVMVLQPRDALRFGYRFWLAQHSGLVLKLQTLDHRGHLLEQAAFSELQLDAPLRAEALLRVMNQYQGPKLERPQAVKTTLAAEGWRLKQTVPGFKLLRCHRRPVSPAAPAGLHCVFSDGLASVSVFFSSASSAVQAPHPPMAMGATHALRTQLHHHSATFMGEVPSATLQRFAAALER